MGIKGKVDKMVVLACEDCKERNYTTGKNKKNITDMLEPLTYEIKRTPQGGSFYFKEREGFEPSVL